MSTVAAPAYDLAHLAHLGSLAIVIGLGDGSLLAAISAHPQGHAKDLEILALPGEAVPPDLVLKPNWRLVSVADWAACERWVVMAFGAHEDITRLAGVDVFDAHPLADGPAAFRANHLPHLRQLISDRSWGLGNDINDTFMGLWHAAQNADTLLPCPSIGQLAGSFGVVPAIAVGAGPSLAEHIDQLRALQDRCIIVACDSVYHRLLDAGVVAHFCTPLERLQQQTQFVQRARGTKTIFAGIAACHPTTVHAFDHHLYLHALDRLYDWLAPAETLRCCTGSSTGVLAVLVAASLTRGPVYLVGHDLCTEGDGPTHWEADGVAAEAWKTEQQNAGGFGANGYEERWIPGNDGTPKRSIMWWQHFGHEIGTQCGAMSGRVFNTNAHTKRYAKIENTLPAPLPDPEGLPLLPGFTLPRTNHARLNDWKERASALGKDTSSFLARMETLHQRILATLRSPPHTWDLDAIMADLTADAGVSAGNAAAFQYFLRSAIYGEQAYATWHARRHRSVQSAQHMTLHVIDGLAGALANAVDHCRPLLAQIAPP